MFIINKYNKKSISTFEVKSFTSNFLFGLKSNIFHKLRQDYLETFWLINKQKYNYFGKRNVRAEILLGLIFCS